MAKLHPLPKNPRSRKTAVKAAGMVLVGMSYKEAAEAAGIGERTLRVYRQCDWWPGVVEDARERYVMGPALSLAYAGMLEALDAGDSLMIRFALERLDPERFGPPKQRIASEHSGPDGAPISMSVADVDLSGLTPEHFAALGVLLDG